MFNPSGDAAAIQIARTAGDLDEQLVVACSELQRISAHVSRAYELISSIDHEKRYPEFGNALSILDARLREKMRWLGELNLTVKFAGLVSELHKAQKADIVEDLLEDGQKEVTRAKREIMFGLVETSDAFERVLERAIQPNAAYPVSYFTCLGTRFLLAKHHQAWLDLLHRHFNLNRITSDEILGSAPPFAVTRIISRLDDGTSDDIVVARIIEHGYEWNQQLIRKASVAVIDRKG